LELFNLVLLNKWKWRYLVDKDAIWYPLLQEKYGSLVEWIARPKNCESVRQYLIWWRDLITNDDDDLFLNRVRLKLGYASVCSVFERCLFDSNVIVLNQLNVFYD